MRTAHRFDLHAIPEPVWYIAIYADKKDKELMFALPVIRRPLKSGQLLVGQPETAPPFTEGSPS